MQLYSVTYCAKNTDPDTNSESVVMKVYDNIKHPTDSIPWITGTSDFIYIDVWLFHRLATKCLYYR